MKMFEDVTHEAFAAARADDVPAMRALLTDLVTGPSSHLSSAVRLWMDRLILVLGDTEGESGAINLKVEMIPDDSGDGVARPFHELRAELSWVGQMFLTYAAGEGAAWPQLWQQVPPDRLFAYVERLLFTMAKTSLAYEELLAETPVDQREEPCCHVHGWIYSDPTATGNRLAKAHLN